MPRTPAILIAADAPEIRAILARQLKRLYPTITIQSAADSATALDLIDQHVPDLLFADDDIPRMDTLPLVSTIRARQISCPIIILSSSGDQWPALAAAGATRFLWKPFNLAMLRQVIDELIDTTTFSRLQDRQAGGDI
jgi:two-component system response regulator PilR (NtrC family)